MGGEYLRHEGAPEAVWKAVKEHYQPIAADDAHPGTPLGCLLSLCRQAGHRGGLLRRRPIPSGSKDPLALRRAGAGHRAHPVGAGLGPQPPGPHRRMALRARGRQGHQARGRDPRGPGSFFRDRVAYQLELAGYAGSVRRSALAAGWEDLADLKARCEALSAFAEDARFASLAQSAKRIGNILKDEIPVGAFDAAMLQARRGEGPGRASRPRWKPPRDQPPCSRPWRTSPRPWRPSSPPSW